MAASPPLVLASASRYRRMLLDRLGVPYRWEAPGVDEALRPGEAPSARALRLAAEKARAVAARGAGGELVIGSDQVADLGGQVLDKPGTRSRAIGQLEASSGATVDFHTAVVLHAARSGQDLGQDLGQHLDRTRVHFRELDAREIHRYVEREEPLDCAGSFKVEALGIGLFRAVVSDDPTALVGLPLIALAAMLRKAGWPVP